MILSRMGCTSTHSRSRCRTYNGIKHVTGPTGLPFNDERMNWVLLDGDRCNFVFLTRRNRLRRIVSAELAQQAGMWHPWQMLDRETFRQFRFEPIQVARL